MRLACQSMHDGNGRIAPGQRRLGGSAWLGEAWRTLISPHPSLPRSALDSPCPPTPKVARYARSLLHLPTRPISHRPVLGRQTLKPLDPSRSSSTLPPRTSGAAGPRASWNMTRPLARSGIGPGRGLPGQARCTAKIGATSASRRPAHATSRRVDAVLPSCLRRSSSCSTGPPCGPC